MPTLLSSTYKRPKRLLNGHVETIIPTLFRKVAIPPYQRQRLTTPDQDFIDLDWVTHENNNQLMIASHGLEGSSQSPYIKGMVKHFYQAGWDCLAWNYRDCSGEPNRHLYSYHSGATDDMGFMINTILNQKKYQTIVLVGFSLGGNVNLKYIGENPTQLPPEIKAAAIFSTPLDLMACSLNMERLSNKIYTRRFLQTLKQKIREKAIRFPQQVDTTHLTSIRTLKEFDDLYTAPIHGFKDAKDYYQRCSALNFTHQIQIPTLIVNAENDPFLAKESYPIHYFEQLKNVFFEVPLKGGHCGFVSYNPSNTYWSERRALAFVQQYI